MLEIDKIRQLIEMMVTNDLVEISLRDGEEEINLRRPNQGSPEFNSHGTIAGNTPAPIAATTPPAPAPSAIAENAEREPDWPKISSPMVGTFYAAADPESSPFVEIGSRISVGTVVCVLEAMKVFNEIKSDVAGTIERILVKNAEAVEFGQALFLVRPS